MKKIQKLTLFLVITLCLVSLVIFEFKSEKYYLEIEFSDSEESINRIESKILYLGNVLNKFFPNNSGSIYLYDITIENYNSTIGFCCFVAF